MKKVALVTGGNKGLGLETARQLGKNGATVVLTARNEDRLQHAVNTLKAEGIEVHGFQVDLEDQTTFPTVRQFIEDKFGRLDILVNNAGVQLDSETWTENNTLNVSQETLKRTFEINFFGLVALTQQLVPLLKKSAAGRVVNLSSILGSVAMHADPNSPIYSTKLLAYNASKAALNVFTIHLAHALKDTNIKVNSAHPGWVMTDMGGESAPMSLDEGAKTSVDYALLDENGPSGEFGHLGNPLPW